MLPLMLDLNNKKAVVFGAGEVGLRKARYLAAEMEVIIVAKDRPSDGVQGVKVVTADANEVMAEWIAWADLVVAATDNQHLNDRIAEEASSRHKFCNRADGVSTMLIPSTIIRPTYIVAISTLGRSPGMSKYLRLALDRSLGPEYDAMIELQEELRAKAKEKIADQRERERFLWTVLDDPAVWDALRIDRTKAKALAMRELEDHEPHH